MNQVERVRALRRLAEGTSYPAEAEAARAKASELQERYGISEEQLLGEPPASRPVVYAGPTVTITFAGTTVGVATGAWVYRVVVAPVA